MRCQRRWPAPVRFSPMRRHIATLRSCAARPFRGLISWNNYGSHVGIQALVTCPSWSRGVARWFRCSLSVSGAFVSRCLISSTMLPFLHPAHRTGHADLLHPALGESFTETFLYQVLGLVRLSARTGSLPWATSEVVGPSCKHTIEPRHHHLLVRRTSTNLSPSTRSWRGIGSQRHGLLSLSSAETPTVRSNSRRTQARWNWEPPPALRRFGAQSMCVGKPTWHCVRVT